MRLIIFVFLISIGASYGQKPALTLESYKSWPEVGGGGLSSDGHYAFYNVYNLPVGRNTFYLKTTTGREIFSRVGLSNPQFDKESKYLYGQLSGDSLLIFDLLRGKSDYIKGVRSFELKEIVGVQRLLVKYRDNLVLSELTGKALQRFTNVREYKFSQDGKSVLMIKQDTIEKNVVSVWLANFISGNQLHIYKGPFINDIIFDRRGTQLAFLVSHAGVNSIYYYRSGNEKAELLLDNRSNGIAPGLSIVKGDYWSFSKDGKSIFFSLQNALPFYSKDPEVNLETWSYQDAYLRNYYDGPRGIDVKQRKYLAVVTIASHKILQLTSGNERILPNTLKFDSDTIFVVESTNGLMSEPWNVNAVSDYYICSYKRGTKIPMEKDMTERLMSFDLSPTGKYFVYFNPVKKAYCCYDIGTGRKCQIGTDITGYLGMAYMEHYPNPWDSVRGVIGWLDQDSALLIQTAFDIWKIDPKNVTGATCLTGGLGTEHKIVFYMLSNAAPSRRKNLVLFSAFNTQNKNFALYEADLTGRQALRLLSDRKRYTGTIQDLYTQLYEPDFISGRGGYLVRWQNADEYPNYFYSRDLKVFRELSNLQPQKAFNWLSAELCNYQDTEGNSYQGLMYKPENFDENKKYPVVFNIYETESNFLNGFCKPDLSGVNISPSVLASNGYVVFQPDIRGKVGSAGEAALNCVMSAVNFLSKYKWADTAKMALVGHSFGGFETGYIVTHTNIFAAACPSAGVHDMIRFASDTWMYGEGLQFFAQKSYFMMDKMLSEDPETYIRNSSILSAKNLQTPLLFMHNEADINVNVEQTRAFFIVLRNLRKPCWWLNYKGQGHGVGGEKKQLDYNTKVWQFLDHYLKDKPMPAWMKEHI